MSFGLAACTNISGNGDNTDDSLTDEEQVEVLYYIGGYNAALGTSETVYVSKDDGATWSEVGSDALDIGVTAPMCFYHENKIWVVGGRDAAAAIDEVQSSSDGGQTWTTHNNALPGVLQGAAYGKIGDTMYVAGGVGAGAATTNVIYTSTNGSTWTAAGTTLTTAASASYSSLVYDDKIWVVGGQPGGAANKVQTFDGTTVAALPNLAISDDWYTGYSIGTTLYFANGARILSSTDSGSSWVNETVDNAKTLPNAYAFGQIIINHGAGAILMGGFIAANNDNVYTTTNGTDWTQVGDLPQAMSLGCALSISIPKSIADQL
jgi:hypothetical protein